MVQVGSLFSRAKLDTKEKLGLPQGQWAGSQNKATTSEHTNNVDNIIMGDEMNDLETMGLAAGGKLGKLLHCDKYVLARHIEQYHSSGYLRRYTACKHMEPRSCSYNLCTHSRPIELRKGHSYRASSTSNIRWNVCANRRSILRS